MIISIYIFKNCFIVFMQFNYFLSYQWGQSLTYDVSDAIEITFSLKKSEDNRNLRINYRFRICVDKSCVPRLNFHHDFDALIPICVNDTLQWPTTGEYQIHKTVIKNNRGNEEQKLFTYFINYKLI